MTTATHNRRATDVLAVVIEQMTDHVSAIDELGDLEAAEHAELVRVLRYIRQSLAPPATSGVTGNGD
jgi:hypothetical protein